ncbi:hypothetical protein [Pseudomonas sp.]|uniref:hypothetical protein n=1 Tax=Pseudomonas sp. TaxID=306 RepID=UPI002898A100|nr:hypothetical protein [Pseudomonas sp.]
MASPKHDRNYGYLNFFEIELSGLYRIQRKSVGEDIISRNYGLGTTEIFREIAKWVKGRSFKETAPWPSTGGEGPDPVMCYCREIKEFPDGTFLVVLWKDDPTDTKGFRGLELGEDGAPTGRYLTTDASFTGDNYVWGHPCYYWIVPDKGIVASIKFEDSKCDADLMQKWVNYCVRYKLKIAGYNSRRTGESKTRICFSTPANPETYNLLYRFKTKIRVFKTSERYLEHICEKTKYVLLRNEVIVSESVKDVETEQALLNADSLDKANLDIFRYFQSLMNKFFPSSDKTDDSIRKVEVKLEATPSLEQMKELLSCSSEFSEDGWADVIFIDEDDNQTSIKSHRIVERIVLHPTPNAYTCDELYKVIRESQSNFYPLNESASTNMDSPEVKRISS